MAEPPNPPPPPVPLDDIPPPPSPDPAPRVGERVHRDMYCLGYWQHDDDHPDGGWIVALNGQGWLSHPDVGYLLEQTAKLRADSPGARFVVCRISTTIDQELGTNNDR